eukprot:184861_1
MATWMVLKHCPGTNYATPLQINANEFIIVCEGSPLNTYKNETFKYNINKNEWNKMALNYPHCESHSNTFDQNKQILYLYGEGKRINYHTHNYLIQIDFNTKIATTVPHLPGFGMCTQMALINKQIHIIGGFDNNTHSIWNETNEKSEVVHTFSNSVHDHRLLHLKSKNKLLLLGGEYHLNCKNEIYEYCVKNNKWKKWSVKLPKPLNKFGIISTNNDNFMIIFGGCIGFKYDGTDVICGDLNDHFSSDIYVCDISKKLFIKSTIKCPFATPYYAMIVEDKNKDELLTFGFVNEFFRSKNGCNLQKLPFYIVKLIKQWVCNEMIHLLSGKYHWKIALDEILKSTRSQTNE